MNTNMKRNNCHYKGNLIKIELRERDSPAGTTWNRQGSDCLPMALRPQQASVP